jgi:hypothetical protein
VKKNIRKVPKQVVLALKSLPRHVVAGVARHFSNHDLTRGALRHLGVRLKRDGTLVLPPDGLVVPPAGGGKVSAENVEGKEVIRKDLGLEHHTTSHDSPNWGDWSNGSHTVELPYEKYPRGYVPPRENTIRVQVAGAVGKSDTVLVFEVSEVLDKKASDFESRLLFCLNLLQENVGACGLQKSGASTADYAATLRVSWDILPPGECDETMARVFRGRRPSREEKDTFRERYEYLRRLSPQNYVVGSSGFSRYFGALIRSDLVVFENMSYGNAVYIMYGDWRTLSQRNRLELLSGRFGNDFDRVVHQKGWKTAGRALVAARLKQPSVKKTA